MAYRANRELGLGAARPLQVRLPAELWKRVEQEAARNGRSLNAEIVRLLTLVLGGQISDQAPKARQGAPAYESDLEAAVAERLHKLPAEKLLALLTLLDST